tara:strand:+ start:432 stop:1295 length:864 start_codon:yes stop_codon:yes gene_type:complete
MARYYSTEIIKPYINGEDQHTQFTIGDTIFSWTSFEIPSGACRLIGVDAWVKSQGNAAKTTNGYGMGIYFAHDFSYIKQGVETPCDNLYGNELIDQPNRVFAPTAPIVNNMIGQAAIESITTANNANGRMWTHLSGCGASGTSVGAPIPSLVFNPPVDVDYQLSSSVSKTRYWMLGVAGGKSTDTLKLTSVLSIAETGTAGHAATQEITTDDGSGGTTVSPTHQFEIGDKLEIGTSVGTPAAGSELGTVQTLSSSSITLTAPSAIDLVDGDVIYSVNPIKIRLHFEY